MATTRTVGAAGDDTTIASAMSFMQANHTLGVDGIGKIEIIDNAEFNESVDISGISGTASITSYIELTAAVANRHSGVKGTGHARIRASDGNHAITIEESFTYVHHLEIRQNGSGASDEGIRVGNDGLSFTDILISYCIIWSNDATSDQDGIYAGSWSVTYSVDNCIIYGFNRGGLRSQQASGTGTQVVNIDYLTIYNCGADNTSNDGGLHLRPQQSGASGTLNVFNTACIDCGVGNSSDYVETGSGTITWTGTNNVDTDGTLTDVGITTNAQQNLTTADTTQSSGSFFVVNDLTLGSEDLLLLDDAAGNLASENGIDRVGSEPDSRQDFSLDIAGNTRSTTSPAPDIGASEFTIDAVFNFPLQEAMRIVRHNGRYH